MESQALSQLLFRSFGAIAPRLTSFCAEDLFFKPSHYPAPRREKEFLATGHAFKVNFRGKKIAAWSWGDATSGPIVYLVHGWSGRGGQLSAFVQPLLDLGFSVVMFDGPGHGQSEGKHASLVAFAAALRAVVDWVGPAYAVIGHSMGGSATAFALANGFKAKRVVFLGSPSDITGYVKEFQDYFAISKCVMDLVINRAEKRLRVKWSDLKITDAASRMTTPLLVVHDEQDKDVAVENARAITKDWPGAKLTITRGLGHTRILRDPKVVQEVVSFIKGEH